MVKNKRFKIHIATLLLGSLLLVSSPAKSQSTTGKTFWMTFMESIGSPDVVQELKIVIASEKAATGTIQNYFSGKTLFFSIGAGGGIDTVLLPASMCYNTGSEFSSSPDRGILIQASTDVSVSAQNSKPGSCDAALIYPIQYIGFNYRIISHMGDQSGNNKNYKSCFVIVATENNTIIDITPSAPTAVGNPAGTLFTVTLQKGETYQVQSSTHRNDLSGTLVQSRDCKKIAVFAGSTRSSVLNGSCTPSYSHLYEQMVPVNYWANKFIAIPSTYAKGKQRKAEMIRIVASVNSTTVRVNGKLKILGAGQSDTFFITSDALIISNKPIGVCQFALSEGCDTSNSSPYMMWLPSVEQAVENISFAVENALSVNRISMNIVARTSEINTFTRNGTLVNPGWQKVRNDTNFSFTRLDSMPRGQHHISCNGGIMSSLYAYGNHGSYGFMNAASVNPLEFYAMVNGRNSKNVLPGASMDTACENSVVSFDAEVVNAGNVTWKWVIYDSADTVVRNLKNFSYKFKYAGTFRILLIAQRVMPGLCNGQTSMDDTLRSGISIEHLTGFELVAGKNIVCMDSVLSMTAKSINWQNVSGFFWTFNSMDTVLNDTAITRTINRKSSFVFTLSDTNQCISRDSIVIDPRDHPQISMPASATICAGDSIMIKPVVFPYFYPKTIQWMHNNTLLNNKDSFYLFNHVSNATLIFRIRDPYGCPGSDSTLIKVNPKPDIHIISKVNYYYTDFVVLKTNKPFISYEWFNGESSAVDSFPATDLGSPGKYSVWCLVIDSNGCVGIDTMDIFTNKVGIQQAEHEYIKVYPNPAGNEVNITIRTGSELIICSMDGKTVLVQTLEPGLNKIDIESLESGLYVLEIAGSRRILVKE